MDVYTLSAPNTYPNTSHIDVSTLITRNTTPETSRMDVSEAFVNTFFFVTMTSVLVAHLTSNKYIVIFQKTCIIHDNK